MKRTAAKKSTVERHKQTEIRVTVGAVPYGQMARETYRPNNRDSGSGTQVPAFEVRFF